MKNTAALLVVLLSAAPALAIELSLEENRAERGSVGYVDMQRLFTNSPDAQRAKESFEELIRQAEERVNLRKAELLKLHQSLDKLRAERDEIVASSMTAPAPALPPALPSPAVSVATVTASAPAVQVATVAVVSPAAVSVGTAAAQVATSSAAAPAPARALALPGMSPAEPAPAAPPAAAPALAASTGTNAGLDGLLGSKVAPPAVAVATAAAPSPAPTPAPSAPTLGQRLLEVDAKIISLQSEVSRKEDDLTREHDEADHGLLDVESRKTDQVLARLYRAITEVAHAEGVSVVVDKTNILYGHPAVDITDKVLKHLKEAPQP